MTVEGSSFDGPGFSWKAFSGREMFSTRWYMRKERIIMYTISSLIGIAAQGAATFCMFKYQFLQNHIEQFSMMTAHVHNNDIEAAGILSMVFPCMILLVFNAEYFRLLVWPGWKQPVWFIKGKKAYAIFFTFGLLATVIISTVIVATRSASITGVDDATIQQLTTLYFRPPLQYNTWAQNIVWLVLLWIAVMFSLASTALLLAGPNQERRNPAFDGVQQIANSEEPGSTDAIAVGDEKETSTVSVRNDAV